MVDDCVFCKIASGDIPCDKVYEDGDVICFRDLNPQAPTHILVVPKKHARNITECAEDAKLTAKLFKTASDVAVKEGLSEKGFRVITNCGPDACQSVDHFHIHVLGGKQMSGSLG